MTRAAVTVMSCDAEPRADADSQLPGGGSPSRYRGRNSSVPALCLPAFQ